MTLRSLALGGALVAAASLPVASGGANGTVPSATLSINAVLTMEAQRVPCAPGTPSLAECWARTGKALVPGLGTVTQTYVHLTLLDPPQCIAGSYNVLASAGRLTVAGKGEIQFATGSFLDCVTPTLNLSRSFTVTGGSGAFAGASGNGTITTNASFTATGQRGADTWRGSLVVPGRDFDLAPPALSGAVSKTVRAPRGAKRVRVTYKAVARDEVDGVVPVSCRPKSGSRFKVGRTVVSCSATDTSGNTRTANFTITVKAGR